MIAEALRLEVERHAHRAIQFNPMLRSAAAGEVGPDAVGRYLASLQYLLAITQDHLRRARDIARARGFDSLAEYFEQKIVEERGHDRWASQDLVVLSANGGLPQPPDPVPAIVELATFIHATIDHDPRDYLSYVLWAEYFTVLVGGAFIRELVEHCGIDPNALTCLARHVELDQEHTDEGLDFIDRFVDDPGRLAQMRQVLLDVVARFDRACEEMLGSTAHRMPRRAVG
jgi:hypothetical protein